MNIPISLTASEWDVELGEYEGCFIVTPSGYGWNGGSISIPLSSHNYSETIKF